VPIKEITEMIGEAIAAEQAMEESESRLFPARELA